MKNFKNLIFLILFIIFEEIVFSVSIFQTITNIGYITLFSIPVAVILYLITTTPKRKWNIFSLYFFTIIVISVFIAQFIYYNIYEAIISFYSATNAMVQIWQFAGTILEVALNNWYIVLLMLAPLIALIVLHKTKILDFEGITLKTRLYSIILAVLSQMIAIMCLSIINTKDIYSNKNLYYNIHSPTLSANRMGIITTMRLDLQRLLFRV